MRGKHNRLCFNVRLDTEKLVEANFLTGPTAFEHWVELNGKPERTQRLAEETLNDIERVTKEFRSHLQAAKE